jgi:glycosyltransferase involved in cell wall biosynthesis
MAGESRQESVKCQQDSIPDMSNEPLVSVVTPVYNGEGFLAECIESVLKQTYRNYEYIIVNNCSKDRTLEIALNHAKRDSRIRVHSNSQFVGVIENHNTAFRLISAESKYCKVVSADDWLFPECLSRMVQVAEANPSVGIVGSYQLSGGGTDWRQWRIRWTQLPYPSTLVPGREICRLHLLGGPYVFGTPTSILYRSDLIKGQDAFYPNSSAEADTSACFKYLQHSDFGFVHQVLSYERVHLVRVTSTSQDLNAYLSASISDLLAYGRFCLSEVELNAQLQKLVRRYYVFLAVNSLLGRDEEFWRYHRRRLKELGIPFGILRLGRAVVWEFLDLLLNPKRALGRLRNRILRSVS